MRILRVVRAVMVGSMLVMPFAASAQLVQAGLWERGAASTPAAGSARVLRDASFSAPAEGAYQAIPAGPQHDVFPPAFSKFGTILAAVLLLLPFWLSTLRILRRHRAA